MHHVSIPSSSSQLRAFRVNRAVSAYVSAMSILRFAAVLITLDQQQIFMVALILGPADLTEVDHLRSDKVGVMKQAASKFSIGIVSRSWKRSNI